MTLMGHSTDVLLADIVQSQGLDRTTCRITVAGAEGKGYVYMNAGIIVHATYAGLVGRDALFALLAAEDVFFQVEPRIESPETSLGEHWQGLLIDAVHAIDEGKAPRLQPTPAPQPAVAAAAPGRNGSRAWLVTVAVVASIGVAASSYLAFGRRGGDEPVTSVAANDAPIEATALSGPGTAQPQLLLGDAPASPDPSVAIRPTIVCRILVAADGRVADAKVYRSRLDLAVFEDVALDTVRGFRFRPASRDGRPIAVWINWPVTFR